MGFVNIIRIQWDRIGSALAAVLGALTLLLGWIGVSGTDVTSHQISYLISGGFFGLFLLGVAGTLWISADLRDEWRKIDQLQQTVSLVERRLAGAPEVVLDGGVNLTPVVGTPEHKPRDPAITSPVSAG